MTDLLDARGIVIEPGDIVIYGFSVGRSVAMAEGAVRGDAVVSLTPTGLVRIDIVRRSYAEGCNKGVSVRPDRLVVLKDGRLPPSPLETQADGLRKRLEAEGG